MHRIPDIVPSLVAALVLTIAATGGVSAASFKTVVIDAGHGGHDRGTSAGLTYEKHLAFDVARRLEAILEEQGIRTQMTRTRDEYVSLLRRVGISNKARKAIFVSVHFNSSKSTKANGLETFFHRNSGESQVLARLIQSAGVFKTKFKDRSAKSAQYVVLSKNKHPAVLVECGFISNSTERARALSPEYRQKLAEGIAMGIIRYKNGK